MLYNIYITDTNAKPIAGATLTFSSGGVLWKKLVTGSNGLVAIDSVTDVDLLSSDVYVVASAAGYADTSGPGNALQPDSQFQLVKKPNYLPYIGIGAALALAGGALFSGRKKTITGFTFLDSLTNWQKIGLAAGAGLGIYYIFFHSPGVPNTTLATNAGADLATLHSQGVDPTISATQADAFSGELVAAFDGCGTDEQAVYNVFSNLRNKADVLLLISVFGVRSYGGCFDGPIWKDNVDYNLGQALSSELSSSEMSHLNNILADNGIQYSF